MSWRTGTVFTSLGRKYIMALTGLVLGGFLLLHAAGNATIFFGRAPFLAYATRLKTAGFAVLAAEVLLLTLFLTHVTTGLLLTLDNLGARPQRYAVASSAGGRSWGSATMPYTGLVILSFLLLHLNNIRFIGQDASLADIVATVLSRPLNVILYTIGLGALALHVSHGFWSLLQSLGISHPRYDRLLRTCAWLAAGLIVTVFVLIVLLLAVHSNQLA